MAGFIYTIIFLILTISEGLIHRLSTVTILTVRMSWVELHILLVSLSLSPCPWMNLHLLHNFSKTILRTTTDGIYQFLYVEVHLQLSFSYITHWQFTGSKCHMQHQFQVCTFLQHKQPTFKKRPCVQLCNASSIQLPPEPHSRLSSSSRDDWTDL